MGAILRFPFVDSAIKTKTCSKQPDLRRNLLHVLYYHYITFSRLLQMVILHKNRNACFGYNQQSLFVLWRSRTWAGLEKRAYYTRTRPFGVFIYQARTSAAFRCFPSYGVPTRREPSPVTPDRQKAYSIFPCLPREVP